jgi:DNA polymerase elongation subunit (family B)
MSSSQGIIVGDKKIVKKITTKSFRLFSFDVLNMTRAELDGGTVESASGSDDDAPKKKKKIDSNIFVIQMYGINEKGETCSIFVDDYQPFFYIKVGDKWDADKMHGLVREIKRKIGEFYSESIMSYEMVDSQKLYGFAAGKTSKFIKIVFKNMTALGKVKNLWYITIGEQRRMRPFVPGTQLYEANLPPLLRFFHINSLFPNGWVMVSNRASAAVIKTTTCTYEFIVSQSQLKPLPDKESMVPYKIMSFDIEADSSHGDFPLPQKTYKRLAINMMDFFGKQKGLEPNLMRHLICKMIMSAFDFDVLEGIDLVFPKRKDIKQKEVEQLTDYLLKTPLIDAKKKQSSKVSNLMTIDAMFRGAASAAAGAATEDAEDAGDDEDAPDVVEEDADSDDEKQKPARRINVPAGVNKTTGIIEFLLSDNYDRTEKVEQLDEMITTVFPDLEGDRVTMIGSTFLRYGETEPYLNHCVIVGGCDPIEGAVVESVCEERDMLMRWADLVQKENPDIIIGYNIFGFDYEFMFRRSIETHCVEEFLQLSRKRGEFCGKRNRDDASIIEIENTKIVIASGEYDLRFITMSGRIQVDMYSYFRRNFNLSSYKLDDVASQNISDEITKIADIVHPVYGDCAELYTKNITGLHAGDFIHIEISTFTSDYYMNGKKFIVLDIVLKDNNKILIIADHHEASIDKKKKVYWGMAKDDVSPQDIFRMSKGSDADRAVVAKYCIQDCNLVHHLMRKIDVLTEYMEMANLCSVPINFLVFRGQGIKLTSYVAKKCMEKGYLMPDLEKAGMDGGYEGAIVLPPKTKIYIDEPVACVDYSSLYPSSMISQNYCHSSKVWAKEYDLEGNLVKEEGEKDKSGNYIYYGLSKYEYVEVEFDTFEWRRNPARPAAKAVKTKVGKRIVCWAQMPNNEKSVMPSILMELLKAREDTKKKAKKVKDSDPFMANILDKRQVAYKVTANSLYGQCGARTSTFYEKDVAASTTASGRMMITYARRIIEEIYANRVCNTKTHGPVMTNAEYVYGDTDSVFFIFNLTNKDTGEKIIGKDALEITIELAQEAADYATKYLKPPMNLAYEKTLMPFALLSKKRYVGILYEEDPNKGKLKYMGLSLKRRDSCDYLKDTYGQIINIIMKGGSVGDAIQYLDNSLNELIAGTVPMDKLSITKSLRSYYKNPQQIAHRVLADRIGQRDPGNMPKAGDRMKFLHVATNNKKALQGEKIETPEFIIENHLKIDYNFYITNQLMKPLCQFMGLALEQIWKANGKLTLISKYNKDMTKLQKEHPDFEIFIKKKEKYCTDLVKTILFDKHLIQINNDARGLQPITSFFTRK